MPNEVVVVVKAKDQASKKLKGVGKQVDGIGSKLKGLGPIGGLAFGAMATMAAKSAFDGAMAFETAFGQVRTLLPAANADALKTMRGQLVEFAKDFGEDSTIAAKSLYQAISAGAIDTAEAFDVLETAAKSATAANTDTATAVTLLSQVMNGYGRENISAEKTADILQTTIRFGMTTFEEMAGSLFQITGLASSLGVSFEQLGAMMATSTAKTGNAANSVTQLKSLFTALSKGSSTLAKTVKAELGASFSTLSGEGMTVVEVLKKLAENRTEDAFRDLFTRVESLQGAEGLLGATKNGEAFNEIMKEMTTSAGALDTAYEAATDTMAHKYKVAVNELKIEAQEAVIALHPLVELLLFTVSDDNPISLMKIPNLIKGLAFDWPLALFEAVNTGAAMNVPADLIGKLLGGGDQGPQAPDWTQAYAQAAGSSAFFDAAQFGTGTSPFSRNNFMDTISEIMGDATRGTWDAAAFRDKYAGSGTRNLNAQRDQRNLDRIASLLDPRAVAQAREDLLEAVSTSLPAWEREVSASADTVANMRHSISDFVDVMSDEVEGLPAAWGASAVHMEDQLSGLLADAQTAADNMATALELAATKGVDASDELERWQGELVSIQGEMATLTEGWAESIVEAIVDQTKRDQDAQDKAENTRQRIEAYERALLGVMAKSIGATMSEVDPFTGPWPSGTFAMEAHARARAEAVASGRFGSTTRPDSSQGLIPNEFFEKVKSEFERLKLQFHYKPGDLIPIGQEFAPDPTGPSRVITASGEVRGAGQTAEDYARERGSYQGANITINVETLIGDPAEAVYGLLNQGNQDLGLQLRNSAVSDSDGL